MNDSIECLKCQIAHSEKDVKFYEEKDKQKFEWDYGNSELYSSLSSIKDRVKVLYEEGYRRGESTGWRNLDKHYTVRTGEWTLVTGIPSHGKSSFLDALMVNLAGETGWNFAIFSAENLPLERHAASLLENWVGKPFGVDYYNRMSDFDLDNAMKLLGNRFYFMRPPEDQCTISSILDISEGLVRHNGVFGIVIDPWNELDHTRPVNLSETEYISQSLSKIRRFTRDNDVHIWLVVHPTKLIKDKAGNYPVPTPYDASGSAHWRNKADNCITVWRDLLSEEHITQVHIQKIRWKEVGVVGMCELIFDRATGRYHAR